MSRDRQGSFLLEFGYQERLLTPRVGGHWNSGKWSPRVHGELGRHPQAQGGILGMSVPGKELGPMILAQDIPRFPRKERRGQAEGVELGHRVRRGPSSSRHLRHPAGLPFAAIPVRRGRVRGGFLRAGHPPSGRSPLDPGRHLHRPLLHQIRPAPQPHRLRHRPLTARGGRGGREWVWRTSPGAGGAPGKQRLEAASEGTAAPFQLCHLLSRRRERRLLPLPNPRAASREPLLLPRAEPGAALGMLSGILRR